ncbi:MAG: flippase [Aphanizomenon flos-aquae KM1D3_PB]|uniref:flippase n=1 Tax=Aphanizomenon flos-aquae TaxID=1176 RepID=UPI0009DD963E|nr:flippase [Aphanizomenon flos-aquae]QSV69439.1 MAG: flippase [Aphanizomenon flos-aquae KM1D3_PB]
MMKIKKILVCNYLLKIRKIVKDFHPENRQIIGNTGWLFVGKVFRLFISLCMGTLVARYLGPEKFGTLQYALAFSSFFLPLSTSQMGKIVTRDLVQKPVSKDKILGTAFIVQIIGGILAATLSIMFIKIIYPQSSYIHLLVAIVAIKFIFNSFQPIENWFESQVKSKFQVLASNLAFLIITIIKIFLIVFKAPLFLFASIISLEAIIYATGLIFYYQLDHQNIRTWTTDFQSIKYLIRESYPQFLSTTAILIYASLDQVMLGSMVGHSSIGIYSSAVILCESLSFLPLIISSSLYPSMIKAQSLSKSTYRNKLQKIYDFTSLLAYAIIILIVPLSGFLINLLYGDNYQLASPILSIYIFTSLFTFQGEVMSNWIVTEGLQHFNLYAKLVGLAANIMLNLLLIPLYQGIGAAIATLVSASLANYFCFLFWKKTRTNAILTTKALLLPFRLLKLLKRS